MGTCHAGQCVIFCDKECICFASTKNPADCECQCDAPVVAAVSPFRKYAADPEALIDVMASEIPLIRLAEMFEYLFPEQVLIPAAKIHERITTDVTAITVADFVKNVGLVPRSEPLVGRNLTDAKPAL
jgi:hypothetical protein